MYRNFCFTLNNWTQVEYDELQRNNAFEYIIIGKEVGETGTPHLQGYCELKKRTRFATVCGYFGNRGHIEARRGTQDQAIDYCKKGGEFAEYGQRRIQGVRVDLDRIRTIAADDGMREVTRVGNLQQIHVAEKFLTYNETARNWLTEVIWIWGPSGSGKSKKAREIINMDDCFIKNEGSKWWDGYDGHEDIILDDFRDSWWPLTNMLGILDRYEYRVEVKGGWRQLKPKRIVITTIRPPEAHYMGLGEPSMQLLRRLSQVINCVPDVPEVVGVILDPTTEEIERWLDEL